MVRFENTRAVAGAFLATTVFLGTPSLLCGQERASAGRSGGKKTAARKASASKSITSKAAARRARVPAALVGTWVWGVANPGKYVNPATGEYVGHAGGGAVSYTFAKDGTHRRYTIIHFGAGFSNESIFSSMEGTADFDEAASTFTVHLTHGQITFEKKKGMEKRPLTREDMERAGAVFTYRLQKDESGRTILMVNDKGKPASEGRHFYKEADDKK